MLRVSLRNLLVRDAFKVVPLEFAMSSNFKNGSFCFCVDLRKVNAVTRKDSFPMPLVSDTLDALNGTKYLSTLDLKAGYWQIKMHPESREKNSFCDTQPSIRV